MTIDEAIEKARKTIDPIFDDAITAAEILLVDQGGTVEDIENMRGWYPQMLEEYKEQMLRDVRSWLERDCGSLQ